MRLHRTKSTFTASSLACVQIIFDGHTKNNSIYKNHYIVTRTLRAPPAQNRPSRWLQPITVCIWRLIILPHSLTCRSCHSPCSRFVFRQHRKLRARDRDIGVVYICIRCPRSPPGPNVKVNAFWTVCVRAHIVVFAFRSIWTRGAE